MAFFIRATSRPTITKYLVQAENADDAVSKDGEYLGYVDGDTDGAEVLAGPFETAADAQADSEAYVEGR